jgi:hypothetical protein
MSQCIIFQIIPVTICPTLFLAGAKPFATWNLSSNAPRISKPKNRLKSGKDYQLEFE